MENNLPNLILCLVEHQLLSRKSVKICLSMTESSFTHKATELKLGISSDTGCEIIHKYLRSKKIFKV